MLFLQRAAVRLPFFVRAGALAFLLALAAAFDAAAQPAPEPASGFSPKHAIGAKRFILAAAHPLAVEAGYKLLQRGGSAIEFVGVWKSPLSVLRENEGLIDEDVKKCGAVGIQFIEPPCT
ncbi:MAG: hypothetical protein V1796_05625 [Pseudomonadota bacterium]